MLFYVLIQQIIIRTNNKLVNFALLKLCSILLRNRTSQIYINVAQIQTAMRPGDSIKWQNDCSGCIVFWIKTLNQFYLFLLLLGFRGDIYLLFNWIKVTKIWPTKHSTSMIHTRSNVIKGALVKAAGVYAAAALLSGFTHDTKRNAHQVEWF